MQSHLWRLGGAWLYSQTVINYCFSKLDSRAHTTSSATLSFLSVHFTEEPKGNSECVLRASKNSCNVKLLLPIRVRSVCAVIRTGTRPNKGCVSCQQLLSLLMQINDNTIAVPHLWESSQMCTLLSGVLAASNLELWCVVFHLELTRCSRITRMFSVDRESLVSWLALSFFLAGALLCFLVEVATQLLRMPKVVKGRRTFCADPCDVLRRRVRNAWPKVTKQTVATKNNTLNTLPVETICKQVLAVLFVQCRLHPNHNSGIAIRSRTINSDIFTAVKAL